MHRDYIKLLCCESERWSGFYFQAVAWAHESSTLWGIRRIANFWPSLFALFMPWNIQLSLSKKPNKNLKLSDNRFITNEF